MKLEPANLLLEKHHDLVALFAEMLVALAFLQWTGSAKLEFHQSILDEHIVDVLRVRDDLDLDLIFHDVVAQQPVVVRVEVLLVDERQQTTLFILIEVILEGQVYVLIFVVLILVIRKAVLMLVLVLVLGLELPISDFAKLDFDNFAVPDKQMHL